MSQNYTPEFKKKIVRLHEEEGRTYKSITAEYGVSKATISTWCKQFREECQTSPQAKDDYDSIKKTPIKAEEWRTTKGDCIPKKRRLGICPNAYYNYRKHRKADYYTQKSEVLSQIEDIYHSHNGVDGYRSMTVYLARRGYSYSTTTIHKYMDTEFGLRSIVRPRRPGNVHGILHRVFENRLKQDFTADTVNQKWCTDLTYLFLNNNEDADIYFLLSLYYHPLYPNHNNIFYLKIHL